MHLDPKLLTQLLDAFHVELEDQLQVITDGLLSLERQADDDDQRDVLHQVFRAAHNIKGSARAVDVSLIADLAHRMESIFAELKEKIQRHKPKLLICVLKSLTPCVRQCEPSTKIAK